MKTCDILLIINSDNHYQFFGLNDNEKIGGIKMVLTNCKKFNSYHIEKAPEIHLLKALGVRSGINITIESKQPFGGPVVFKIGNRSIAVAKDIAREIIVREAF